MTVALLKELREGQASLKHGLVALQVAHQIAFGAVPSLTGRRSASLHTLGDSAEARTGRSTR